MLIRQLDYGIGFAYIIFNIFTAILLYYLIRVRKGSGKSIADRFKPLLVFFNKNANKENEGRETAKVPQAEGGTILP